MGLPAAFFALKIAFLLAERMSCYKPVRLCKLMSAVGVLKPQEGNAVESLAVWGGGGISTENACVFCIPPDALLERDVSQTAKGREHSGRERTHPPCSLTCLKGPSAIGIFFFILLGWKELSAQEHV